MLGYTTLYHATVQNTTVYYKTRYTNYTTQQLQSQLQLHYTYYYTLHLQLQMRCTTLHPAVVGEVTAATIATTPKNTTPTTCQSISGFALPSVIHNNQPLL